MSGPVIVIALDAADPDLYDALTRAGRLGNLRRLRDAGCYIRMTNIGYCSAEAGWTTTLSGVSPEKTGFWSQLRFDPDDYGIRNVGSYDYERYPLFYELAPDIKLAAIDIPQSRLSERVDGVQVLGYGSHSQQGARRSRPEGLLEELIARYGPHPAYEADSAVLWSRHSLSKLTKALETGARRRGRICRDLLRDSRWDLFFTVFGESHSSGHYLWHCRPDHAWHEVYRPGHGREALVEVLEAVDEAMGEIIDAAPAGATFVVFSQQGMVCNNQDLTSLVFLPELMYRMSFPGTYGMGGGPAGQGSAPDVMTTRPRGLGWTRAVLSRKHDENALLRSLRGVLPIELSYGLEWLVGERRCPRYPGTPFGRRAIPHWMGPMWYRSEWPQMKAFALPSFSDGYVRVNLRGRERQGVIEPADYAAFCEELLAEIRDLRNARTGEPVAREVIRTRRSAADGDASLPDPDLVVKWEEEPADVVDSTRWGRIGPVPYRRSGGHNPNCFAVISGPGIREGSTLPPARVLDVAPTILSLLGAPIPGWFDGQPLKLRATQQ